MLSDVEVQNPPPTVPDDEKAVEHTECDCRNREDIHRRNSFAMIALITTIRIRKAAREVCLERHSLDLAAGRSCLEQNHTLSPRDSLLELRARVCAGARPIANH